MAFQKYSDGRILPEPEKVENQDTDTDNRPEDREDAESEQDGEPDRPLG